VIVKDERKTKKRLIAELDDLRQQLVETKESLAKLEALAAEQDRVERELGLYAESLESLVEDRTRTLQESGESFRSLAENAADGILISIAEEGRYVYANKRAAEITGYSIGELLKACIKDITHPDTFKAIIRAHKRRLVGEEAPRQYEAIIVRMDGAHVPVELTAARTTWHGQPAVMAIVRDITERKRAEERLTGINECFVSFGTDPLENINLLTALCGETLAATCALYNRLDGALLCSLGRWNTPSDYDPVDKPEGHICYDVIQRGKGEALVIRNLPETPYAQTDPNVTPYGLQTYVGWPVKFGGTYVGSLCVVYREDFDPSEADKQFMATVASAIGVEEERRRAEGALRESEERYRAIFEQAADSIVLIDAETGALVEFNDRAHENLGYTRKEFERLKISDFEVIESAGQVAQHLERIVKAGKDTFETKQRRKDGEIRDILVSSRSLSVGGSDFIQSIWYDITERVRSEGMRAQAEETLAAYAERLRALHEIDQAILEARSPDAIAQAALQHIQRVVPCQWASVATFDSEISGATILAINSARDTGPETGAFIPLEPFGDIIDTLRRDAVFAIDDILTYPEPPPLVQAQQSAGVRAFTCVPLMAQGRLIGALNLSSAEPGSLGSEQMDLVLEIANQLAIAIRQADLNAQVQSHASDLEQRVVARTIELERRTVQLQTAAAVARDAAIAHDLGGLLNRATNLICKRFGFYHAGIFLVDAQGEYAVLRAAAGVPGREMIEHGHKLKVGEVGIVGYVTGSGKPRIALDVGTDAVHFKTPYLPDTRSEMALPLKVGERIIGALDVQSTQEAAFGEEDVAALQIMADQLAMAIERTRLFEQTQAALEEQLSAVVSNAPIVLFAIDLDGVFTLSEGKGLEALGVKPGDHVGKSIFDVYSSFPRILEDVHRALAGETVSPIADIGGVLFESWYTPLLDQDGEITGAIGVATDVTEREHLEAQIRQQERLAAVGQLAGGIAHDFNNYLTTIMLYAQILLRSPSFPQELATNVRTILDESRRAVRLVQQILDFSRRSMMETQLVDLGSFIEEVTGILRRTLPESIRLLIEVEAEESMVQADPTRIQQALMNLALNARDAMPQGGELSISLSKMRLRSGERDSRAGVLPADIPDGEWVCMAVSDTGVGMTEEVQSHLFEPFFTTKGAEGTGLGLAQVHGIVKQHGGYIGVETALGQGATFCIYLPAHEVALQDPTVMPSTIPPTGDGELILLVEDEDRVREAIHEILETLGYRVLIAANGRQALEVYQSAESVDLVLTDVVMPEMGGIELVRELRKRAAHLKALAITGYMVPEDLAELHEAGIGEIVSKPVEVHTLAEAVHRLLHAG
jgi:PAS domain S-box-containing protein